MKKYLDLLRLKHYIKNILIFVPLIFHGEAFNFKLLTIDILGFVAFSLTSSVVYVINDLHDIERDKKHPTKRERPLAKGTIKNVNAYIVIIWLVIATSIISVVIRNIGGEINGTLCLLVYLLVTFGVYLIHPLVIDSTLSAYVRQHFYSMGINRFGVELTIYMIVLVVSYFLVLLIRCIPGMKKIV